MRRAHDLRERLPGAVFAGYEDQYERMRALAGSMRIAARHTSGGHAPLDLNLGEGTFTSGLLRAWAMVGEILSFYQERIAEEGYLPTVEDPEALRRILRSTGIEPVPRVAASAYFDFAAATRTASSAPLIVPVGTSIRATIQPGKPAEIFEVSEGIEVRGDWNEVRLSPAIRKAAVQDGTSLRFKGVGLGVQKGTRLLLLPERVASGAEPPPNPLPASWLPTIIAIEEAAGETTLRWIEEPGPGLGDSPAAFLTDTPEPLFGHLAPDWDKAPPSVQIENGGRLEGGVLRSTLGEAAWTSFNRGIPLVNVGEVPLTGLVVGPDGVLVAGSSSGVLVSREGDEGWTLSNDGLTSLDVTAVHAAPDGSLYAGTNAGTVFRSTDGGRKWGPVDGGFTVVRQPGHGLLKKKEEGWKTVSTKLPVAPVRALAWIDESEAGPTLIAATDQGVFQSDPEGGGWFPETEGALVSPPIREWTLFIDGSALMAVAGDKRFVRVAGGDWEEIGNAGPQDTAVGLSARAKSLSSRIEADGVVASLVSGEIVRWNGKAWQIEEKDDVGAISSFTSASDGTLYVVTPSRGVLDSDWPAVRPAAGRIDLARPAANVVPGTWVALSAPGTSPALFRVGTSEVVRRTDLLVATEVTRLGLPDASLTTLSRFSYRTATVLPTRRRLELADVADATVACFEGLALTLSRRIPDVDRGRRAFVLGKHPRVPVPEALTDHPMAKATGEGEISVPYNVAGSSDGGGFLPSLPEDEDQLEATEVASVDPGRPGSDQPNSRLNLQRPLDGVYDPASVRVHLNATLATHGKTVANEALGDGDASKENQRFALRQGPLVYLRGPDGPVCTLRVSVDGVLWEQVLSLLSSKPSATHYVVRLDESQHATIHFGDGRHGARLPTGVANVAATYRVGDPDKVGDLSPGFALWDSKPSGIDGVRCLGIAQAASPPVELVDASQAARRRLETMDRAVTVADVARLARDFKSVALSDARVVSTVAGASVLLSLVPAEGQSLELGEVEAYVRQRQGFTAPVVAVLASSVPVGLEVRLTIVEGSRDAVLAALPEALESRYGYGRWPIGRDLRASEIDAFLQRMNAVLNVEILRLGVVPVATGTIENVHADVETPTFPSPFSQSPLAPFLALGFTFRAGDAEDRNVLIASNITGDEAQG